MPNIKAMETSEAPLDATFRFLRPDEGGRLTEAIRVAYGDSYDVPWVYDEGEVGRGLPPGATSRASRRPRMASCSATRG